MLPNTNAPAAYSDLISTLRSAYDRNAEKRDQLEKSAWKLTERSAFLGRLRSEGKSRLLELGAGAGQDSLFFQDEGLEVVATDLSPEMVAKCRAKGLDAHVMDFLNLTFPPGAFNAGYTFNSLLHVPNRDLDSVLESIARVLAPGALLYLGVYGGEDFEGHLENDSHQPPRFFSLRSDETLFRSVQARFEFVDFHAVPLDGWRFQALTVRKPG
jgi:SAM-dependent methyltransferase